MNIGETMQLGPFTVRCTLRFDNPAFPRYLVFRGDRLVGAQFSMPNESDCRWLARGGVYASDSATYERFGGAAQYYKRGATSDAYQKLRREKRAA